MNELLSKLLESELLTEESKQELTAAFNDHIVKVTEEATLQATADVTAQLHEQHLHEKDMLIEAIDQKVNEFLTKEFLTLKEDVSNYKNLESDYTMKLAKEKKQLGEQFKKDLKVMAEKMDSFLETRITAEFDQIKKDIYEAKKLDFGRKIFEAYSKEFKTTFVDPDQTEAELMEAKVKLDKLNKKYKNIKKDNEQLLHKVKVESTCSKLSGSSRELMESILQNVATDKVTDTYKLYINRVLKESTQPTEAKETIVESVETRWPEFKINTGDGFIQPQINEAVSDNSFISEMTRLAGID
jgi:hypothetical protein